MHVQSYLTQVIHGHSRANLDQRIDRLLTRGGPHVHVTLLSLFRSGSLRAIMPFVWQQAHQQFGMYRTLFDCRIYEDLAQKQNPIKNLPQIYSTEIQIFAENVGTNSRG